MTGTPDLDPYLAGARARAHRVGARAVLCDVALSIGLSPARAACLPLFRDWTPAPPAPELCPPMPWQRPDLLGVVHEALLDRDQRRRTGAFYTPAALADSVAATTLEPLAGRGPLIVCDPAAGGGALLLAALRFVLRRGADAAHVRLVAIDLDPLALAVTEAALLLEAPSADVSTVEADALTLVDWPVPGAGRYDAVLANPPFLSQLAQATARSSRQAADAQSRFGVAAAGYADAAGLFALLAVDLVRPGGRIGLILPEPIVATRDGAPGRVHVGSATRLDRLWLEPAGTFAAGVRVCVAVMQREGTGIPPAPDPRWRRGEWSSIAADALGVPDCRLDAAGDIEDMATCSADFRDQFYGLARIAIDDADPTGRTCPAVITSGLIDVLDNGWGTRTARIAGRDYLHPRADTAKLGEDDGKLGADDGLRRWVAGRLVPKVLLATQTAVLEAIPDPGGLLLPMVPVVSVIPRDPDDLWMILAVLSAPPVSALARRRAAGAALSRDAIKLSARQVANLPLPADRAAWAEGAHAARQAATASADGDRAAWRDALGVLGSAMCTAYGVDAESVLPWWWERVERTARRRAATGPPGPRPPQS